MPAGWPLVTPLAWRPTDDDPENLVEPEIWGFIGALQRSTVLCVTSFFKDADCSLSDFVEVVEQEASAADYPHASSVTHRTVVYESHDLRATIADPDRRQAVLAEIAMVLDQGPGIVLFKGALESDTLDSAAAVFDEIIAEQRATDHVAGDHYAKPGANDRIWNALEKLALCDPDVFVDYYQNDMIELASQAWLGPGYQITSQINVVNPGGEAQQPHRDYHLGFLTNEQAERYPRHVHLLSPVLTLQGAIAHCHMPVETGPTMYLPHSHKYEPGYLAWRRPEFREYFAANHVQLPLAKGDAVFFNPALFHAAGTNRTTDVHRMANLLQVSSAFGRVMESVDYQKMCNAVYPALLRSKAAGMSQAALDRVVAACSYGYPFPTNLDKDPPVKGLAPPSPADVVRQAVREGLPAAQLRAELAAKAERATT